MALDLKKDISLPSLPFKKGGGAKKGKSAYPEKTYINLVQLDKKAVDLRRSIPTAIIAVIVVVLFAKFGVMDFYAQLGAKQSELSSTTAQLTSLQNQLVDYNAVLEEYEGYESKSLSDGGISVNAMDVIALVDNYVAPMANVATMSISGNTLSLSLTDISLDGVGQLSSTLYEQPIVQNVSVSTASTRNSGNENVTAAVTVTLVSSDSGSASSGSGSTSSSSGSKSLISSSKSSSSSSK